MNTSQASLEAALSRDLGVLSRRRFFRFGLAVGAGTLTAVSTPASAMGLPWGKKKDGWEGRPEGIHSLTAQEYQVFDKLRRVLLPTARFNLPSTDEVPVMTNIDDMIGKLSDNVRDTLQLGVKVFETGSLVTTLKFSKFSSMTDEDALAYVNKWQEGLFVQRGLMTGLKSVVLFAYWRDSRTWSALEYDGPVTEKWGIKRLGNAPLPID